MIAKLPIIGSPVAPAEVAEALRRAHDGRVAGEFAAELARYTGQRYVYTASSGIACYYLILKALKERYGRTEVILPAYTAGSLVVAVRKAGLRPVLVDISLGDFNADVNELENVISHNTLALTCVHMFGIGMEGVDRLRGLLQPAAVLIEDCCQSMGSTIRGSQAGSFGDIAFYSFNRGKNFPLSGGGCITTGSDILQKALAAPVAAAAAVRGGIGLVDAFKNIAFIAAANPHVYGSCFPLVSRFKETAPPEDFGVRQLSNFQASLGLLLMKRQGEWHAKRYANGMALLNGLKDVHGVLGPVIPVDNKPAFNRLPIVFEDAANLAKAEHLLWDRGIEASRMYIRPLHHMFDLGYPESAFPHANYFAQRLLTLPVHPGVTREHIDVMVGTIRSVLKGS